MGGAPTRSRGLTGLGSRAVAAETVARETASGCSPGWEPLPRVAANPPHPGSAQARPCRAQLPFSKGDPPDPSPLRGHREQLGRGDCEGDRPAEGPSRTSGWLPGHALHRFRPQFPLWAPRVGPTRTLADAEVHNIHPTGPECFAGLCNRSEPCGSNIPNLRGYWVWGHSGEAKVTPSAGLGPERRAEASAEDRAWRLMGSCPRC